jgi:hypothetical protein
MSAIISSAGFLDLNYPSFPGAYTGTEFGTGLFVGNYESTPTVGVYVDALGDEPVMLADGNESEHAGAASAADVATFDLELSPQLIAEFSAIAVGQRFDGMPGAWIIRRDGSVSNPRRTGAGDRTSSIGVTTGAETHRGWTYQANAVSSDGRLIVGTATLEMEINPIRSGTCGNNPNVVSAGTQIAVYWTVDQWLNQPAVGVAQPLGEVLRCGTAGNNTVIAMTNGLIEANDVFYDVENDVYVVSGRDQNGGAAIATLDP